MTWQVADAVRAMSASADHAQALYRAAQLSALRASIGARGRSTRSWPTRSPSAARSLHALTWARRRAGPGGQVRRPACDLILAGRHEGRCSTASSPPRKEAEANLIRRREETASVRSQANTAKLLAESPAPGAASRSWRSWKEVLAAGAKTTFVFGSGMTSPSRCGDWSGADKE